MSNKFYLLALFAVILFASCSSVSTWSDHSQGTDYSNYGTYSIDEQCSDYNPGINPINQQRIKNAIELEFRSMGYKRSDNADINVKFFVKNETKYFYENCLQEYKGYKGGRTCVEKVHTYEEGTLVIDFIDIKTNTAIWHGGASGNSWETIKNPDIIISKMVGEIFDLYKEAKAESPSELMAGNSY